MRERGFDPVLHERGAVAYGSTDALERYCYKEIETCDILLSIVGGRFGSQSNDSSYSISQTELKVALESGKQVYVFVDSGVYHEHKTFERNKDTRIKWASVDNLQIFAFLSEIYDLKNNNPVQPFDTSFDIVSNLREQWAGLFQRLLVQQSSGLQASLFHELKQALDAARSLVDVVSSKADKGNAAVADIILTTHPLFAALRKAMGVPYRFVFEDVSEFETWISARGFSEEILNTDESKLEWFRVDKRNGNTEFLTLSKDVFDGNGRLRSFSSTSWQESFVEFKLHKIKKSVNAFDDLDDDVPF